MKNKITTLGIWLVSLPMLFSCEQFELPSAGFDPESILASSDWKVDYQIQGKKFPNITLLQDDLRYPGRDKKTIIKHNFDFRETKRVTKIENYEVQHRFYTSGSEADWAISQSESGEKREDHDWNVYNGEIFIDGVPFELQTHQFKNKNRLIIKGFFRYAGYSEDLRKSIRKVNGFVTDSLGVDIDLVLTKK
jgi:hypothetical protein